VGCELCMEFGLSVNMELEVVRPGKMWGEDCSEEVDGCKEGEGEV
jgi:hypothetical protein